MNFTSAQTSKDPRSTVSAINELVHGIQNLFRGEIQLARAELQNTAQGLRKNITSIVLFASIAMIGILPFIAFLVIGLGKLLNDQFWLSSLIISVLFMGIGGIVASISYKRLKDQNFTLPQTRQSVQEESKAVTGSIKNVTETFQRRAS